MVCKKCSSETGNNKDVCALCESKEKTEAPQKKNKIVMIVAIAVVAIIAIFAISSLFSGGDDASSSSTNVSNDNTPESVAEVALNAIYDCDMETIADLFHEDTLLILYEYYYVDSKNELVEVVDESLESALSFILALDDLDESALEDNLVIEIVSVEDYDEDELADLSEAYLDVFDLEIEDGYYVYFDIDYFDSEEENNQNDINDSYNYVEVIKIDSVWYLETSNFDFYFD